MKKTLNILLILLFAMGCSHKVYYWHVDKQQRWTAKPYPQDSIKNNHKN